MPAEVEDEHCHVGAPAISVLEQIAVSPRKEERCVAVDGVYFVPNGEMRQACSNKAHCADRECASMNLNEVDPFPMNTVL